MERVERMPASKSVVLEKDIVRFDKHQIIQHIVLFVTFIVLALTGLPLKFNDWSVSQWWIEVWGGIENTRTFHRISAYIMTADCIYHLLYVGYGTFVRKKPFPISIVPSPRDFVNLFQEVQYFVGLSKEKPKFDRFNWREKFDYWAIFWGMPVIGISGFIMAYPVFVTKFLPGWVVPAAIIAHGDEAILAVSWIVLVHFVFNHLSPGNFPLNKSIFTGKMSKGKYHKEHPLEYNRLMETEAGKGKG